MISVTNSNEAAYADGKVKLDLMGLSTDIKPTTWGGKGIANGSMWQDIDTGAIYCYDEAGARWCQW